MNGQDTYELPPGSGQRDIPPPAPYPYHVLYADNGWHNSQRFLTSLQPSGYDIELKTVDEKDKLESAVKTFGPDIIIVDFIPGNGEQGITHEYIRSVAGDIPVIFLINSSDEEPLLETVDLPAINYVYKDRLKKLRPMMSRLLNQAMEKRNTSRRISDLEQQALDYLNLVENLNVIVFRTSLDGKILRINRAFCEMSGYDFNDIIDLNIMDLYQDPSSRCRLIDSLKEHGIVDGLIGRFVRKDGSILIGRIRAYLKKDTDGNILWMEGIIEDITQHVNTEVQLNYANRQLSILLNSITDIIIGVSQQDVITYWNQVAESVFAIGKENMIGKKIISADMPWAWEEIFVGISDSISEARAVHLNNIPFRRPDGDTGLLDLTINPMRYRSDGDVEGFIILGRDLTAQKELEKQLHEARKLEAVGQLAAGISHEINSPMQFICDNIDYVRRKIVPLMQFYDDFNDMMEQCAGMQGMAEKFISLSSREKAMDYRHLTTEIPKALGDAFEGTERIRKIINSMKRFSHPGDGRIRLTDINSAIQTTVMVSKNEWKYTCELVTDLREDLPEVPCIESELNQVILNVIINARDAIGEAITKKIIDRGMIRITSSLADEFAEIRISDNGPGIPDSIKNRIFEPFFTTKEVGRGTGQGLSLSHAIIVNRHHGSFFFENMPGHGTAFVIRLPLTNPEVEN